MGHNADDFEPFKSESLQPPAPAKPTIESLAAQAAEIKNMLGFLMGFADAIYPKAGQRVMWQDKVTAAGITLEGTSATAPIHGVLLGANFIPTGASTGTVLFVVRPIGQQTVTVIDSTKVKFVDD